MIASGNVPMEDICGTPIDVVAAPMSGELSRWVSRLAGYAALLVTCVVLLKTLM